MPSLLAHLRMQEGLCDIVRFAQVWRSFSVQRPEGWLTALYPNAGPGRDVPWFPTVFAFAYIYENVKNPLSAYFQIFLLVNPFFLK